MARGPRPFNNALIPQLTPTLRNPSTSWLTLAVRESTLCLNLAPYPDWLIGFENDLHNYRYKAL